MFPAMRGFWAALSKGLASVLVLCSGFASAEESDADDPAITDEADTRVDNESPEALIARGIEFRKRREDRLALAAFERAWMLGGSPRALAQLALAEQSLGLWREAFEHLENALSRADDPWISAHHATLEVALGEIVSRLGTVEISCNIDGAEVKVDGRSVGPTPLRKSLRVVAGKSVVQVVAQGYFDMARHVHVEAGGISRVSFSLTPISASEAAAVPAAPALTPPPLAASPPQELILPRAVRARVSESADENTSTRDLLTYTSAGLAALGVTLGVTGYVMREIKAGQYNNDARCAQHEGVPRSIECKDELEAGHRAELIAITGASAAGLFGLTALYLWWSRPEADASADLSCAIVGAAVICGSAF
jgi:hypothetical protein